MKKINAILSILTALVLCVSCNSDWEDEQFTHLVSFKAPINSQGVTSIYLRYKDDGKVTYQLPLVVSGTTTNDNNMTVRVAIDPDTLVDLNEARFSTRTELYYQELTSEYFSIPETASITAGQNTGLLPISFSLTNLDLVHKWVLPLTILESQDGSYQVNERKDYRKALLRIVPFNDYSGSYSSTTFMTYFKGSTTGGISIDTKVAYVVDSKTIFFYAGLVDEDRTDREYYKIFVRFNDDDGQTLTIYTDNPAINLNVIGTPVYSISEEMDATLPYLKNRNIILDIEYEYTDYTTVTGLSIDYYVVGSLALQRKINIQIPDEDQAIVWD
ncbi:hypothetical protein GGR21_001384 [Dysgonomonas hofstadii]|uniref:DUF4973 domain-containing protein n=1 Tax=Dysgonomonas hofstadii TaxID=637886 RepID=A0A840CJZ3_9BACT|nr:DUF4973 domain-containing protein [Dysgonomonas hofstadii]MBB4035491.1 hypothetical protein [Dysgonomonas hofstadii]